MKNIRSSSSQFSDDDSSRAPTSELGDVAHRYFFFGWMFRNAAVSDTFLHHAALRFNIEQRRYLPIYMYRWLVIFASCAALGSGLERLARTVAAVPYLIGVFALCYVLIAAAIFLCLECASRERRS